ncbi:RHS repeat-associated core domain-containing protein [Riemerella columbina]|uniref:RHS repeat-associated core domain-containing protein n=1 Tax=Riemerella columbina TaxID=103810 RepID=UPI00035FF4D7|nr:RHS repeat-associated core domain-containing protein [Riemerella columbina]
MPYLFNGKKLDQETGLYYYGARYYDARVSLWLNVDPLVEKTMQPYAYTNNNPVMLVDPTGMDAEDCPKCPKPNRAEQTYSVNNTTYVATPSKENAKNLEWLKQTDIKEVTLTRNKADENIRAARLRLSQAIENSPAAKSVESFERNFFYGTGMTLATGGVGGFTMSGSMASRAIAGRFLVDAGIQFGANLTTNGLNVEKALRDVNFTQSILAGGGMNYIGNTFISNSIILSKGRKSTILNGGIKGREFAVQTVFGMLGGAVAGRISNSSSFKGVVLGTYMQTTSRFGQTAGTVAAGIIINSPDYGTSVIQNKIP